MPESGALAGSGGGGLALVALSAPVCMYPVICKRRGSWPRGWRRGMMLLAFAPMIVLAADYAVCQVRRQRFKNTWTKIQLKMTERDVVQLLGKPTAKVNEIRNDSVIRSFWSYRHPKLPLLQFERGFPYLHSCFPNDYHFYHISPPVISFDNGLVDSTNGLAERKDNDGYY